MKEYKLSRIGSGPPDSLDKKEIKKQYKDNVKAIGDLQNILYAQGKYALLVVIQGMDAAGKDSAVRDVFEHVNPSGMGVKSFKRPTDEESSHDFLWRIHKNVPAKGTIQVFNRSHYEDVLIQRVHHWIDDNTAHDRFRHINNFEDLLENTNTKVIKFYLHISKEQQYIELNERKTDPAKHWKHNDNDWKERELWEKYMKAYEDVFKYCSPEIPWNIIPSDENWYKEYLMSEVIRRKLEELNLEYPTL